MVVEGMPKVAVALVVALARRLVRVRVSLSGDVPICPHIESIAHQLLLRTITLCYQFEHVAMKDGVGVLSGQLHVPPMSEVGYVVAQRESMRDLSSHLGHGVVFCRSSCVEFCFWGYPATLRAVFAVIGLG